MFSFPRDFFNVRSASEVNTFVSRPVHSVLDESLREEPRII